MLFHRDPNLVNTLNLYDGAADSLAEDVIAGQAGAASSSAVDGGEVREGLSKEALLQAVVGTIGDLDSPLSPDQKGFEALNRCVYALIIILYWICPFIYS